MVFSLNEATAFYRVGRQEQMNYRTVTRQKITAGLIDVINVGSLSQPVLSEAD